MEASRFKNLHWPTPHRSSPLVPALLVAVGAYLALPAREGALLTLLMIAAAIAHQRWAGPEKARATSIENSLNNLPDGALVCDGTGKITANNRVAQQMLGGTAGSLVGQTLSHLLPHLPPGCQSSFVDPHGTCCLFPHPCSGCLVSLPHSEGEPSYVELKLSRLPSLDAPRYLCLLRDVTDAKRAELALARNERLLHRILEALPVGVWVTDAEGEILFDNPAGRAIWQDCVSISNPEPKTWWPMSRERLPEGGDPATDSAIGVYEIVCKDGRHKTISCVRSPFWNGERREGTVIVQQDVSDVQRVKEDLRLADAMLDRMLYSLAVGVVICDMQRRVMTVNDSLCKLLGYDEYELRSRTLDSLIHPADAAAYQEAWAQVVADQSSGLQLELRCRQRNGQVRWALVHASVVRDRDDVPLYLVCQVVDIQARKAAEKSLAVREHLFTVAQRVARLGYWEWQPEEGVFRCSPEAGKILGMDQAPTSSIEAFHLSVHREDRALLQKRLKQLAEAGREFDLDCRLAVAAEGGRPRIVKVRGTQLSPQVAAAHFVGTVIDITDHQDMVRQLWESRDSLRLLSARQEKMLEQERKHIAMELHDELGQLLTGIKMANAALHLRYSDHPMIDQQASRTEELAEKAIAVVRQVATNLRPLALDMGLIPALSWQARNFQRMFGIPCHVFADEELPLQDERLDVTVFRVVQEALTNISRHAAASSVEIHLEALPNRLEVKIKDNGNGFNPDALVPGKTLGLLGQRERMHSLGGTIDFESIPGTGTTVILAIPLPHDHSPADH